MIGTAFERLTVVALAGRLRGEQLLECRCVCGTVRVIRLSRLRSGETRSCGCIRRTGRDPYRAERDCWRGMIRRCEDPQAERYPRYGARGIRVCDRWRGSFEAFLRDIGQRPSPRHEIDRIDNDGHYEPGNVRWATRLEQAANRSVSRLVTIAGVTKTVGQWSKTSGVPRGTIGYRLDRGLDPARAVFDPPGGKTPRAEDADA